ncbi:MAG: hypothetical protein V7K47_23795 [Nostoc sp.]
MKYKATGFEAGGSYAGGRNFLYLILSPAFVPHLLANCCNIIFLVATDLGLVATDLGLVATELRLVAPDLRLVATELGLVAQ